jgi:GcrA cell cycle regulator
VFEVDVAAEPQVVENIVPMGQRCSILELNESTCRWPIGDPSAVDFFFCGGKTIEGLPYCGFHSRIAYQPASERRRDRRPDRG